MSGQTNQELSRSRSVGGDHSAADRVGDALMFPIAVARRVLPDNDLPIYLGAGALAVAGVIDWPVAAAVGLGYAAVKRWGGSSGRGGQQRGEPAYGGRYRGRTERRGEPPSDGEVRQGNPSSNGMVRTRRPIPRR